MQRCREEVQGRRSRGGGAGEEVQGRRCRGGGAGEEVQERRGGGLKVHVSCVGPSTHLFASSSLIHLELNFYLSIYFCAFTC